ncbi:MAG: ABC transporter substrate-binding protein [Acidobacteria bacterium]|nr:ABC transporter substrate-binding protein [Acidobacteriota bacterium]
MNNRLTWLGLAIALAMSIACSTGPTPERESGATTPVARTGPASTDKNDYPVFPDADAGADPAVPAEQGGKGFKGEGWETNTEFDLIGDPHALKGGTIRDSMQDFPGTLRMEGPESNSRFSPVTSSAYESLLGVHPTTLEYIPSLATHWQISPDKMTYRFRIDPNARFSDGVAVTSEDVVATYDFLMDKTLQAPLNEMTYGKLERPVAESKYIVRVHAKELNWRNFLYFSGMAIFPAHILKTINGEKYIKEFNYKLLPGTGPYTIREEDIVKGNSITLRRRKDYWAEKARANVGLGNFDELRFIVIRDESLAFERFKKGELDVFPQAVARQWVEDLKFDNVQRGLIQKRIVYNNSRTGFQGFAMNTRRPPFNDLRVRKALALLLNRRLLIEKTMYNLYEPQNSYFPGVYENPNNPRNEYNPQEALRLLAEAGWNSRDAQGRLTKNGVPFETELLYETKTFESRLTIYQEDLRKVGITLNLRLITQETQFQMVMERRFQMVLMAWSGLTFPNPESTWHSSMADPDSTNNITGFKNARVDELCKLYDRSFDIQERIRIIREIDGIVANDYPYVLHWSSSYVFPRLVYWNKFGAPPGYVSRTGTYYAIHSMWWIDPEKDAKLQQALRDPSMKLEVGPEEDRYWLEYAKKEQTSQIQARKVQ